MNVLISGAASGIGWATTEHLVTSGHRVILVDRDEKVLLTKTRQLPDSQYRILISDISDNATLSQGVNTLAQELGGIDGVVAAAGIVTTGKLSDLSPDTWGETININLTGVFYTLKSALPWLLQSTEASVVTISSVAALTGGGFVGSAAYAASKGGVISLTKAIAREWAPRVRANAICPGPVTTPLISNQLKDRVIYDRLVGRTLLDRLGAPDDIANLIEFLISAKSSYITGQDFVIDGGITL